ncbi:MAG TPA: tetratricopeptide repeat protein [bacterium]|nr:tetratricopeptide repeat protein [bacterium]
MMCNTMKNKRFLIILIAGGFLSACSTTPAPSIYKGAPVAQPAPKVDPNAPVVRPLSAPGFKETPLEAKPLPAKPLNSYAPSALAPSAPMAPGVDYAQVANAQVNTTAASASSQLNKGAASASTQANAATALTTAKLNQNAGQVNQAATTAKTVGSVALPAASLNGSPAARELASSADAALGRGDLTASAASLERALRIEPNNAGLWSRLAEVRLRQGDTAQAEQLALKANGLAGGDAALRSRNDKIVAQARAGR